MAVPVQSSQSTGRRRSRIAYGHPQHQRPAAADAGHYLQAKVRGDVWVVLQQLRQQHALSISGAAHHLMRLGAGLDPLPPLDHLNRTQPCVQTDGH
jgi:hypothetical protein